MSCQQVSRFQAATLAKSTAASRRIATASAAAAAATATAATAITAAAVATATSAAAATAAATLTPVESIAAAKTTSEDTDPYAFTETVAVAPPILFNAQKSRARLSDSSNRSSSNKRQSATSVAASRKANLVLQVNATAAAATAKAQASLATNTTTTNFHHVTQSQRQSALSPVLQLQLPLQSLQSQSQQSQASPKRATNVCIVRPQQQQQQDKEKESCQPTVAPPPPPLYSHTPSLWQTPLLLDNGQKQPQQQPKQQKQSPQLQQKQSQQLQQKQSQQLQQNKQQQQQIVQQQQLQKQHLLHQQHLQQQQKQQQHLLLQQQQLTLQQQQQQQSIAISLVSPPTSPASLTSPTLPPATAAVTAMVAPISVSPKGGLPLPPSKFHHTTLAQHLQKVECLKKKKSLPLASQNNNNNIKMPNNNNNVVDSLNKPVMAQGQNYNQTQPPPLTVFNTSAVATASSPIAVAPQKHSSGDNTGDLNEIPVNVIFRMPSVAAGGGNVSQATDGTMGVKMVTPLTPPTPPEMSAPPLLAHMHPPTPTTCVPALTVPSNKGLKVLSPPAAPSTEVVMTPPPSAPQAPSLTIAPPASSAAKKNEQMSSKAAAKRQASTTPRRGNINNNNIAAKKMPTIATMPPPPPQEPLATSPPPLPIKSEPAAHRQRRRKLSSKRCCSVTLSENDTFPPDSPYCLQQHWLHSSSGRDLSLDMPLSPSNRREERIALRKGFLRRQALQLLSTRSLQDLPMRAARLRLQCVQNLLLKYQDHAGQQQGIGIGNRCLVANCKLPTLSMAAHCERHIVNNSTQQLFQPCVAWRVDGTACQAPVFDVLHTLALCTVHSHLRAGLDAARPPPKHATPVAGGVTMCVPVKQRKRKANPNPVARPQKRGRKPAGGEHQISSSTNSGMMSNLPLIPTAGMGMQRKSSTTSLESIASNSHSSAASHSQVLPYTPAPQIMPQLSIPPALAPLSGDYQPKQQQPQQQPLLVPKLEAGELPLFTDHQQQQHLDIKAEEISQIVAQLAAAGGDLHHNNNNNSSSHNHNTNNNSVHFNNNNNINYSNNNNQHSFPSFNTAFGNAMGQPITTTTAVTTAITHNGPAATPAPAILANTADLLGQDMFGICENSSAYASSEDTGLGGISESELMAGAHDADDIALNGAHLLEEHDLVNVFDTLPDDAFNELFQSVQQAESEAMDRALEIADKNLKCLQQTIGGSADSADFLNDFLDVSDDLLADAVMHSPNTSGIDAATLFVDSSSGGGNSSSNGASSDIRGLVLQT